METEHGQYSGMESGAICLKGDQHAEAFLRGETGLQSRERRPCTHGSGAVKTLALCGGFDLYCGWDERRLAPTRTGHSRGGQGQVSELLHSSFSEVD